MKFIPLLSLALSFAFFLPVPGRCGVEEAAQPHGRNSRIPAAALDACRTVAAILVVYPSLEVRKSEGPVRDFPGDREGTGCRIAASGPSSGIAGEIDPADAVRNLFREDGWIEDVRYAADGPGTTSFVFRKNGVCCRAGGGAHSWIEDGKAFTSETYELEAECIPDTEGPLQGPHPPVPEK
jgi:hypothetical protein